MSTAPTQQKRGRKLRFSPLFAASLIVLGGLAVGSVAYTRSAIETIAAALPLTPDIATLPVSAEVVDRNGLLLRPFTTADGRWRLPITPDQVDRRFIDMLLAYEDQRFETHHGIDWSGIGRAGFQYITAGGKIVSGGSTLTMQVARLIENSGGTRNLDGKIRQMVHADRLESELSKDQILTLYLTLAPYGGNIEGVRAASLAYFGKEPTRLTTAESALLVALPQSPEARRPDLNPKAAKLSRDMVLDRMVTSGLIGREEADAAKLEPMPKARREFPKLAAHLAQQAVRSWPEARRLDLTIDRRLQQALEKLGASRAGALGPQVSVAIVVADQESGDILASVGSSGLFNTQSDGYVDMTKAVRSPGSTLKPLIYGLGFELGLAHPESLIEDRPTAFGAYVPVNFDNFTRGTVTIRQALTESLNIPAVVVLDAVGTARLVSRMNRAHARPILPQETAPGLAVGLGGVGVTLRDLVSLYAAIGRGGSPVTLNDGITPRVDNSLLAAPVLDPVAAYYVSSILREIPPPLNGSAGRVAYKTGTSYGYRDAWAIGFDGKNVIGVWVGRPDGVPVPGISGIKAAAPILFEAFDRIGPVTPFPAAPQGTINAANPDLPEPLRRFRHPNDNRVARDAAPEIAFPADGVDVDLGIADGSGKPLIVKVRNGQPPFTFFANGAPFGHSAFTRQGSWTPDGPGYVTVSVVDAKGRSDAVKVFLD
ncbi:MAG: penicillin-binding protein 1C [Hyphomicrobiales bacterium]|nr:MAG: penicillin-binding protein 1C [Hyphomicrobiales bacterium]